MIKKRSHANLDFRAYFYLSWFFIKQFDVHIRLWRCVLDMLFQNILTLQNEFKIYFNSKEHPSQNDAYARMYD
jgi:hypothetical protein